MDRLEKLATPFTAATVMVPDSVPLPGLVPIATVMLAEVGGAAWRKAAWIAIGAAGSMAAPAVALAGWTAKPRWLAAAGLMLRPAEVAPVSGADAAVSV